jgi:hypothetical protein
MLRIILALNFLFCLLYPTASSAWGYQGHKVVGAIADRLLSDNAKLQVKRILGEHIKLQQAGPWADCVKSVQLKDGNFSYVVDPDHYDYEVPCKPFRDERDLMVDYASHNWATCLYQPDPTKPPLGCHNTFHFEDVAIQRNGFDRSFQGTNEHDLVAVIGVAIAVLSGKPSPSSFAFKINEREALLLLTHFIGDLHQPLHVGSVYLDAGGKLVDPDVAHVIDPANETTGGNALQDQNVNLHHEWDDIPTDIGEGSTRELLAAAKLVPKSQGQIEGWPAAWASESILVARNAFEGLTFKFNPPQPPDTRNQWFVSFDDHTAYLWLMDQTKRKQLAKGGARLAEILNAIWP